MLFAMDAYILHFIIFACVCQQFAALQLYRQVEALRRQRKKDPATGEVYGKKGMAQCCRKIETDNNLQPGSISKSTLNRWHRSGVADIETAVNIKRGIAPVLPLAIEENLIKLVLACDARGDEKAGPPVVRRAVGLYIQGTVFEKDFRHRYPGRWKEDRGIIMPGMRTLMNTLAQITHFTHFTQSHTRALHHVRQNVDEELVRKDQTNAGLQADNQVPRPWCRHR